MAFFNNPTVSGVGQRTRKTLGGFQTFILRGNVVDLAVGIMIGAAFSGVINSLVSNVITPLIPVPGNSLANVYWTVPWTHSKLQLGAFINAVIAFLILAIVVYFFIVRPVNALVSRYKPKENEVAPATRDCPYCLSSNHLMATRCAYCTSPLPPPPVQTAQPAPLPGPPPRGV